MESVMKALKGLEEEVVTKLSIMYKFDKKEAMRRLHEKEEPSIPLPFTGEINKSWCLGMKKSHGLYNQCTSKRINERLCNKCQKEEEKLGKVKEGYIEERLTCDLMDYKDVKSYGSVLEKLKITKEKALEEAARFNVVIPEEQFEIKKKVAQRGRPTKEGKGEKPPKDSKQLKEVVLNKEKKEDKEEAKIGENTPSGVQGVQPPKKRGRPKKEQKKVVNNCGEELIAALVKEAEKEETEDVFETAKKAKAEAKKKEQEEKKQKEEEKAKQVEKKREEEAKRMEEEQAKQAAKKREEEEKQLEEKKKENTSDELCEEEVESEEEGARASATEGNVEFPCEEDESEEEEEITVSKFEFNGKKYLKSSDNILYDPISQDPVGIWNEDDECIDEIEDDDE
jgi:hypothetical protein